MITQEKLDLLSSYEKEVETLQYEKQVLIDKVMTADVKKQLDDIDAEFGKKVSDANAKIADLQTEVKQDVIALKTTIRGKFLMAVYNKARVTWDNKGLEGFMVAHPEIVAFRKEGEPTVTLRKVGKGE